MNVRLEKLEKKVGQTYSFESILGESKSLKEAVLLARKVAVTDVPVLLTGETGTGKEVFAQAIHYNSKRAKQNFVAVNCSSFSKELLESEMFGHKAGSFTGALKDKKGLFEEANHGTIFLDEIGEMAFELQAKLLRILETGEYIKIGDTKPKGVFVKTSSIGLAYFKYTCRRCASVREISACWQRRLYGTSQHNCRVPLMRLLPNFSVHWNNNPGKGISASCVM